MKDTYGREIDYLRISVTDRCNLRCLYCMPKGIEKIEREKILRDEEIIRVVDEASKEGIKKVRITGGEPMVRKNIIPLISKINEVKGIEEIVLTTNGTLLLGNVEALKKAGVKRINLSIDSLRKERIKKITHSEESINYYQIINELIEHKISPIKVNVVLLKGINDDEILDFLYFAQQFNLVIRFIELMPFESDNFDYEKYFISKEEIIMEYDLVYESRKNNVEYYLWHDQKIGFINSISSKFCEECNRLRLTSDGYIKPCLHSNKEYYVKDEDINVKEVIQKAIKEKPKQHDLDKEYQPKSKRSMNKIGG